MKTAQIEQSRIKLIITLIALTLTIVALATPSTPALAQEHGNGALQIFDEEGQANSPAWVRIWLMVLLASFAAGLLFVWKRVEARWVVGGMVLGIAAVMVITRGLGVLPLSGLLALSHLIFWTPALVVLLKRRTFLKERSLYGAWTGLITAVILFSFIFDIRDAAIYLHYLMS